jgi:hypothetical protein
MAVMTKNELAAAAATAGLCLALSGCSSYWFQNTFDRTNWVKETCAKIAGGMISWETAFPRLGLGVMSKEPTQANQQFGTARTLCYSYGISP